MSCEIMIQVKCFVFVKHYEFRKLLFTAFQTPLELKFKSVARKCLEVQ